MRDKHVSSVRHKKVRKLTDTNEEKAWLNAYHQEVYEKLSPYLNEEVCEWLKEYTRAI